ncbi:hypothetical protein BH10PSE6_BH10PSE6_16910 [soil metagenome]
MTDLVAVAPRIPAMSPAAIDKVRQLEQLAGAQPQVPIVTGHVIHGGLYARTICLPAGVMITGALVKRATLLIVSGDARAYIGDDEPLRLQGYTVLPASAGRKQAFVALADTHLTMLLPTQARTVEDVEREFTDEIEILLSRRDADSNHVTITGE